MVAGSLQRDGFAEKPSASWVAFLRRRPRFSVSPRKRRQATGLADAVGAQGLISCRRQNVVCAVFTIPAVFIKLSGVSTTDLNG